MTIILSCIFACLTIIKMIFKFFMERELYSIDVLQGHHVEMLNPVKSIREKLPEVANGLFSVVLSKPMRIKEAVESDAYSDNVKTILDEDPCEDLDKMTQKIISDLNTSLRAPDIRQFNEMLNWAIFGLVYFGMGQIRAALILSFGRLPVQPLENNLKRDNSR